MSGDFQLLIERNQGVIFAYIYIYLPFNTVNHFSIEGTNHERRSPLFRGATYSPLMPGNPREPTRISRVFFSRIVRGGLLGLW